MTIGARSGPPAGGLHTPEADGTPVGIATYLRIDHANAAWKNGPTVWEGVLRDGLVGSVVIAMPMAIRELRVIASVRDRWVRCWVSSSRRRSRCRRRG